MGWTGLFMGLSCGPSHPPVRWDGWDCPWDIGTFSTITEGKTLENPMGQWDRTGH